MRVVLLLSDWLRFKAVPQGDIGLNADPIGIHIGNMGIAL